ncbi:uncharacterized protein LOC144146967 isoform X3 [Haemaphysalis longicornis]
MIALFCLLLLCISMPMTVKSETCGGSSGPPCNISVVFAAFQNAHLVAITPNWEFDLCIILVPHENFNGTTITAYYRNGTLGSQNKETYTFTDEPDVVNMTLSNGKDSCFFGQGPQKGHQTSAYFTNSGCCMLTSKPVL